MLGTQKGFTFITTYSGISEISQFQIFSLTEVIHHTKVLKMPNNYIFQTIFFYLGVAENSCIRLCVYKDRDIKTIGRENFFHFFLSPNHILSFTGNMFPWHSHLHTLATISPTVCFPAYLSFSFWLPLLCLSCSSFLFFYFSATLPPSLFFLLPKVFESLLSSRHYVIFFWIPQQLIYIQVQVDINFSAPPSL